MLKAIYPADGQTTSVYAGDNCYLTYETYTSEGFGLALSYGAENRRHLWLFKDETEGYSGTDCILRAVVCQSNMNSEVLVHLMKKWNAIRGAVESMYNKGIVSMHPVQSRNSQDQMEEYFQGVKC